MPQFSDPNRPDVVYSGRDQDPPSGLNLGNSEALRAMGEILGGDQGFEFTPTAVDREYGAFTRDVGLASRIATLESKIAAGAEFVDLFNRGDSDSLGSSNPGVVPNWIEFGDGQPMRIIDQAAQLSRDAPFGLVAPGVRYALCPFAASSDDFTVSAIVHPISGPLSRPARTSIYGRCNASGTEGVWVDFYAEACYIGSFTRSGNVMTRSAAWKSNTAKSYSNSSTVELRMTGTRYQVVIDGLVVIDHTDTSGFPIDGNHRYAMFSLMTWTGFFVPAEFSAGLTGFAVRSTALTAVQQAQAAASSAQQSADNAVGTAVTQATAAAQTTAATAAAAAVAPVQTQVQAVRGTILSVSDAALRQSFNHSMVNAQMTFDGMILDEILTFPTRTGSGGSSGNSHSHAIPSVTQSASEFTPPINVAMGGWVSAKASYTRESFVVGVGAVAAPACSFGLAIMVLNPETGNVECRWASGDVSADLGTSARQYVPAVSPGVLASDGQAVLLIVQQWGSGNVRPISARRDLRPSLDSSIYPAVQYGRFGVSGPLTAGAVLPVTSLDTSVPWVPWLGMGPSLVIPPKSPASFYETFDAGLPTSMSNRGPSPWVVVDGALAIPASFAPSFFNAVHNQQMSTNNHLVEGRIINPSADRHGFMSLRSTSDGGTRIVCEVRSTGLTIIRQTGSATATLLSVSVTITSGDVIRISVAATAYRMLVNGVDVGGFTDTGNVLPVGSTYRWVTVGTTTFNNIAGPSWDYFAGRDVTA